MGHNFYLSSSLMIKLTHFKYREVKNLAQTILIYIVAINCATHRGLVGC
jgi:hypothetical protein